MELAFYKMIVTSYLKKDMNIVEKEFLNTICS